MRPPRSSRLPRRADAGDGLSRVSQSGIEPLLFPRLKIPAMKRFPYVLLFLAATLGVHAASAKSYQVTGPVIALTDTVITVQKGDEKWEIARTPGTKVDGKLAVGSRVTVHYKMSADHIEAKDAAPANATKPATKKATK